jgi:hypothetical protein
LELTTTECLELAALAAKVRSFLDSAPGGHVSNPDRQHLTRRQMRVSQYLSANMSGSSTLNHHLGTALAADQATVV